MQLTHNAKIISVVLPIKMTNRNDGQGHGWYRTASDRDDIESTLLALQLQRATPIEFPCVLHLTRILGKREQLWDADSGLRGNAKQLIDSLVAIGWFYDDSLRWIKEVRFFQDDSQRKKGSSILVEVFVV